MNYGVNDQVGKVESILLKKAEDAFVSQEYIHKNYEKWNFISEPDFEIAKKEYEEFLTLIQSHVTQVYYLPKDECAGMDSIYTHDAMKMTKMGAVYLNPGKKERANEIPAMKKYMEQLKIPTLGEIKAPGTLEGGDMMWLDEKTVAIGLSCRTNQEGISQFTQLTKDFIETVITVPLPYVDGPSSCLHLTSLVSMVNPKLAVIYSKFMPAFFRDILLERGIKLLEVNDEDYENLGSINVCLDHNLVVMLKGCKNIVEQLRKEGVTVLEYEGDHISVKGTGGPSCLTNVLCRK